MRTSTQYEEEIEVYKAESERTLRILAAVVIALIVVSVLGLSLACAVVNGLI